MNNNNTPPSTTTTTNIAPNNKNNSIFNAKHLYSGGIAGIVSRTATAPLERIKILNQVQPYLNNGSKYQRVVPALRTIVKEEGVGGLFKGNLVNVCKAAPQSAIRFYTYEAFKKIAANKNGELSIVNKIWAGASAGVSSVVATYPLEVIKTRLSVDQSQSSRGITNTIKSIYQLEGFTGFYRGMSAGILNIAPFSALNFTFYEFIKEKTIKYINNNPPLYFTSIYGALSGTITMSILYPLDVAKRRIMLQRFYNNNNIVTYRGFFDAMVKMIQHEGVLSLYKGIIPAYLKVIPTVSINFLCYEGFLEVFSNKKSSSTSSSDKS
eukprot:gene3629-4520_t